MTAADNLRSLLELQEAINKLPKLTCPVILEDDEGGRYELVKSLAIGAQTTDPGLVLRIRRTR